MIEKINHLTKLQIIQEATGIVSDIIKSLENKGSKEKEEIVDKIIFYS